MKTKKMPTWLFGLSLSALTIVSCSQDENLDLEETNTLSGTNSSLATPSNGRTYTIRNRASGLTLDISRGSNNNGANLQVYGSNANTNSTHRQWEVISTGGKYIRLKGVDSGKSLEVANGSNKEGANVQQWAYQGTTHQQWEIISTGSGYFRIKSRDSGKSLRASGSSNGSNADQAAYDGGRNQQWFFTQVGSGSSSTPTTSTPNNGGSSSGDTAREIIGSGWKLNGFSGSLRVGNNDNGLDYRDSASTSESHFFFERNGYAAFRCYPGSPTSGGSSNPRSELREQIGGGDGFWDGDSNTEHSMKWRFRIEDLPPSGKLAFGQIHEKDDPFDDVIRVQVEGSNGQNSGNVKLRILGYVTEELEGSGRTIDFDMRMDTEYYFELTMRRGVVRLYNLNNSGNRTRTLYTSRDVGNADNNYFKAGCYLQSTKSSHEKSNVYGQVLIKDLEVNPDN